jgi:RNA polymerase sigma-70 factor (ECF subfamily)
VTEPAVNPTEPASGATSLGLLERAKSRDREAWERLASLYAPLVDRWCRQAGLQEADAADVRQEVFLAVSRKIGDFRRDRPGDTFRGWLRIITQHKISDQRRQKQGQPVGIGGTDAGQQLAQTPSRDQDESEEAAVSEEARLLHRRALELVARDFEERTWQAFWRVVIDGHSPADVAEALAMTTNAVYLAKARVLARLREEFRDLLEP